MRLNRAIWVLAAVFACSATASAQLPTSKQSNSPTSNEYRMRVTEPIEGATIRSNDFNVVVAAAPATPPGTSVAPKERADALKPTFQVWVDGKDFGNIAPGTNVMAVRTAGYGPHKIVVAAKNTAGELIDRKEISVITAAPVMTEATAPVPAPAPRMEPATAPAPPPPPAPAAAAPPASYTSESSTLPKTGSSAPRAALLGMGLIAGGLLLRRRA
jgi:LPXTG-motif cell wall-anchored protein